MKTLSFWKKSVYSGLIFFGTVIILTLVYAGVTNVFYSDLPSVNSGSGLTATSWNNLVNYANKAVKQDTEVLTVTGGKVGIGTTSPGTTLSLSGSFFATTTTAQFGIGNSGVFFIDPNYTVTGIMGQTKSSAPYIVYRIGTTNDTNSFFQIEDAAKAVRFAVRADGNVGIGTTSPSERLDLGGGNIKMGLSYQNNVTISNNTAVGTMSAIYMICPSGTSVIGATCWNTANNVACPAYYGVSGNNANISAWNCGNATASMMCSAVCANMK